MPLVAGPFLSAPQSDVTVQPGVYDFTDDAVTLDAEISSLISGWDAFFTDLGLLAADPLDDLTDSAISDLLAVIGWQEDISDGLNISGVLGDWADAQQLLQNAVSFAPGQAWNDPPAPFIPPSGALNIAPPSIPLDAFTAGTYVQAGAAAASGVNVVLLNTTRVGQSNFVSGDQFSVIVTGGKPGQTVTVHGLFNGQDLGTTTFGTLDNTGSLSISGTMAPDNVGAWQEYWYVDGTQAADLNFVVTSGE